MRQAIVDLETTVRNDLTQINDLQSREKLEHLSNTAKESLSTMQKFLSVSEEHLQVSRDQLQLQQDMYKHTLSQEEKKCHQLFRLTESNQDVTYEWYKGRVEERVEGTCEWFLNHEYFQTWLGQDSGPLLVSADPGCGKSVLAKYLIDKELPKYGTLFREFPFLIRHAMPEYSNNGSGLANTTESLWKILEEALLDSQRETVIIVLDALDECEESNRQNLLERLTGFYRNKQDHGKIKYLLTSRPYPNILEEAQDLLDSLPNIHIPGDTKSDAISEEVNLVIKYKIGKLANRIKLKDELKENLTKRLLEMTHRTYLWVYLIFDYLETSGFKKTKNGIELAVTTLPENVNEAYEIILSKNSEEHTVVRKVLSIILAASRPLTLEEMNIAVNIDNSIIHHDKVYFLHQTAREFLLPTLSLKLSLGNEPLLSSLPGMWKHSISVESSHETLAGICLIYLNFFNNDNIPRDEDGAVDQMIHDYCFLDYSANNWSEHFRAARICDNYSLTNSALAVFDGDSNGYPIWFEVYYWQNIRQSPPKSYIPLMIASYFGHESIVKAMLDKGANIDSEDDYGETPLSLAATCGHEAVVKLLLDQGANVDSKDKQGQTPLFCAANSNYGAVLKLLLDRGANIESQGQYGATSLLSAANYGYEEVVKILLDRGANIESKYSYGATPLLSAAHNSYDAVVKLLLDQGAHVDSEDALGQTPLSLAAERGYGAVIQLLLNRGANVDSEDIDGLTPLLYARKTGHEEVVDLLQKATGVPIPNSKSLP